MGRRLHVLDAFNVFAGQMRAIQDFQPQTPADFDALKARAVAAGEETARTAWMLNRAEAIAGLLTDRMHTAGMLPPDRRLAIAEIDALSVERIGSIMYDAALAGRDLLEFANERFDSITAAAPKPKPPFGVDAGGIVPGGGLIARELIAIEEATTRLRSVDPGADEWLSGRQTGLSRTDLLNCIDERFNRIAAGDE